MTPNFALSNLESLCVRWRLLWRRIAAFRTHFDSALNLESLYNSTAPMPRVDEELVTYGFLDVWCNMSIVAKQPIRPLCFLGVIKQHRNLGASDGGERCSKAFHRLSENEEGILKMKKEIFFCPLPCFPRSPSPRPWIILSCQMRRWSMMRRFETKVHCSACLQSKNTRLLFHFCICCAFCLRRFSEALSTFFRTQFANLLFAALL